MLSSAAVLAAISAGAVCAQSFDEGRFSANDIVEKDVAIIGGGASGTYAAVRLREDFGVSVVVVEKEDHLVRHSETCLSLADH